MGRMPNERRRRGRKIIVVARAAMEQTLPGPQAILLGIAPRGGTAVRHRAVDHCHVIGRLCHCTASTVTFCTLPPSPDTPSPNGWTTRLAVAQAVQLSAKVPPSS